MVDAVFFDAVGTLIHPHPSAAEVYAEVGREFGTRYGIAEIGRRFVAAFRREEDFDRANGWRTNEDRERRRWRDIVAAVLDDVSDYEACFRSLYEHFAQPTSWRCDAALTAFLHELANMGCALGLASNYDHRLHNVLTGLPQLSCIKQVVISAEIGWRKPAAEFFAAMCAAAAVPAERILLVGDDLVNDYQGAIGAGLQAFLLRGNSDLAVLRSVIAAARRKS